MNQDNLFHEDIYDALSTVIGALGGRMAVGLMLKPELKDAPASAEAWVGDCVNRNRRQNFKPQQLIFLLAEARKVNCHALMWFFADTCDYLRPEPVEPETEMARLSREVLQMSKEHMELMRKYERMVKLKQQSND